MFITRFISITVTYTRPLRTNEPVKDRMIPERETSVIAAIGHLNARGEANAHERFDKTTEDIRIDFTSSNVHECTNSLYNIPDTSEIESWIPAVITNQDTFRAKIGPTGSKKGYSRITGIVLMVYIIKLYILFLFHFYCTFLSFYLTNKTTSYINCTHNFLTVKIKLQFN